MRKRDHPTDDQLVKLLGEAPAARSERRSRIEAHVQECSLCTTRLGELRELIAVLREADVWDRREPDVQPRREWMEMMSAVVTRLREEETEAEKAIRDVLTGPAKWWRTRALQTDRIRTYGFVKKLLEESIRLTDIAPGDAVEASALAVEIASEMHVHAYPFDLVISSRAHAWREHAYALFFVGRFPEALQAIEHAEKLFGQLPVPQFDLARTALVRAAIYRSTDRAAEAIPLTRDAAASFLSFGDRERYAKARMTEAALLHERGLVAEALAVWKSLEAEPAFQSGATLPMLLHNIGTTYRDLGQFEEAHAYLARAAMRYDELGMPAERVRSRWVIGDMLVMEGRVAEGLPVLRQVWREFDELEMVGSAALVALQVVEALLIMGKPDEVPTICRTLLDQFTRTGRTSRAVMALGFLREAVALGKATPSLVQQVRDFIRDLPKNPARAFRPPAL